MRRRMIIGQLIVIAVISVLIVSYAVFDLLGVRITDRPYPLSLHSSSGGGIFAGAEVAYRGVAVGKVETVTLARDGVTVRMAIDHGTRIPSDATANITDLSVVGEQYVNLVPGRGPVRGYLAPGAVIPANRTTTPPQVSSVIYELERFINSINPRDLQVIGREFSAAFAGTGTDLKALLTDSQTVIDQLSETKQQAFDLLHNTSVLLAGAAAHAGQFRTFATSLEQLSGTLAQQTPAFERLAAEAAPATRTIDTLLRENGSSIAVLLGNMASVSQIQVARVPGLKSLLVAIPAFAGKISGLVKGGTAYLYGTLNRTGRLCNTGVPLTDPLSSIRTPLYAVSCPSFITRGAANAPRPGAGTGAAPSDYSLGPAALPARGSGAAEVGSYDPQSGLAQTSDGRVVRLGSTGGQASILGSASWAALLMGPA